MQSKSAECAGSKTCAVGFRKFVRDQSTSITDAVFAGLDVRDSQSQAKETDMSRQTRGVSNQASRSRSKSALMPVMAAVGLFAVVLGAAFYVASQSNSPEAPGETALTQPQTPTPTPATEAVAPQTSTAANEVPTPEVEVATAAPQSEAIQSPRDLVEAQLASGEFGPAMQTANAVVDLSEQAQLFQLISDAQLEAGDFDGSLTAIRRISIPQEQASARSRRATSQALAGGGAQADFDSLIELIQQETSGPWMEVDGTGGTISEYETGVRVDPNGMLHRLTKEEQTNRLQQLGNLARVADLNEDMASASGLRLVSLTRLEREVSRRLAAGEPVVSTMKHLAGLSSVQYVFVYPDSGEIVIGGPAEGWQYDARGLPRGTESGRPTLQLDDLVTVLRTFAGGGEGFFNCLIVPRQENMKALEAHVAKSNKRGPLPAGAAVRNWVQRLENLLGEQDVVVNGIPLDSRAARVIVEADYRMKLIGIDRLNGGDIESYFDLLPKTGEAGANATIGLRWWMQMKYDAVLHSADRNVFEVQGSSVQCLSEDEKITADGKRIHTGKSSPTNRLFAQEFTNKYAQLAQGDVAFADLQNVMDLSLVAALISHEQLDDRADWKLGVFGMGGEYKTARFEPPKTVPSVAKHRVYNGKDIVVQVAGGVRADLMAVVKDNSIVRMSPRLDSVSARGKAPQLPHGRWWWDAVK
jgi:hypothetical protein